MMQRQFAVYALLHVSAEVTGRNQWLQNRTFYVGSTTTGIHAGQDARWRKYRCLEQGQFVNVGLVMHYLHSRDLLQEVAIMILLFNLVNARSKELSIIQKWRPMYNHPWISRLHPTSIFRTTKLTITALSYTSKSSRLWKKVRRRLQTTGMLRFYLFSDVSPYMGWDLLMMLAAGGQLAFDASRRLRSSEFSHLHVFAFHRLANHLDDPPRTREKALLKQVLQFRALALPRQCRPLIIQMLAHTGFKTAVKTFLRQQMVGSKAFLVPFHLPSTQVVAGKAESIKDILYNHLRLQKSWSWTIPPMCPCSNFCVQHPQLQKAHGHIASPARLLNISTRLCEVLRHSASTEVPPSFRQYLNSTSTKIQQWMHNNGLNNFKVKDWQQFIGEQWQYHVLAAWVTVKSKDLKFLRSLLQDFLVHGRDHAINEIFFFACTCTGKSFVPHLAINKSIGPFLCHRHKRSNSNPSKDGCSGILGVFLHEHHLCQWHISF